MPERLRLCCIAPQQSIAPRLFRRLRRAGEEADVAIASTCEQALDICREAPDRAFVVLHKPGEVEAPEVAERLRRRAPDGVVVVVVEKADQAAGRAAMRHGADALIYADRLDALGDAVRSARRRVERETEVRRLREVEARHRLLLEDSPAATLVVQDDRVVAFGAAAMRLLGDRRAETLNGASAPDLFGETAWTLLKRAAAHEDGAPRAQRWTLPDRREIEVEVGVRRCAMDGRPATLISALDVTDREEARRGMRRLTQEREAASDFVQGILDALPASIALLDSEGVIREVNSHWVRFGEDNGAPSWRGGGRVNYLEVCDAAAASGDEEARLAAQGVREVLAGKRDCFQVEYPCHSLEAQRWFVLLAAPMHAAGRPGAIVMHVDVTDRRLAQEQRAEREHLHAAVSSMERMLGVVGHELRTPLAAIRATSEHLIAADEETPQRRKYFLAQMRDEAARLAKMVGHMLEAAQVSSGGAQWQWSEVSLEGVCEEVAAAIMSLADPRRVAFSCAVVPPGLRMTGDADALRRLALNLASNALRHTGRGRVDLRVREERDQDGRWVVVEVEDTGEGVSPEVAGRMGEAFTLSPGAVGDDFAYGTGLGLSICRGIATAHGGSISYLSSPGVGSVFTARLRADLPDPVQACAMAPIEGGVAA